MKLVLLFSGNGRLCCWLLGVNTFNYTLKWSVVSPSLCFIKLWFNFEKTNSGMSGFQFTIFVILLDFGRFNYILCDMSIWILGYFKYCLIFLVKGSLLETDYGHVILRIEWTSCSHFGFRPAWHCSIYVLHLILWNIYMLHNFSLISMQCFILFNVLKFHL